MRRLCTAIAKLQLTEPLPARPVPPPLFPRARGTVYLALYYYLASHSLAKTGDSAGSGSRAGGGAYAVADSHNHHQRNASAGAGCDNDYYKSLHGAPPAEICLDDGQSSLCRSSWLTFEDVCMTVSKKGGATERILNSVTGLAGPELL